MILHFLAAYSQLYQIKLLNIGRATLKRFVTNKHSPFCYFKLGLGSPIHPAEDQRPRPMGPGQ